MLFDLQGKRKRFIQVIYVFLALLLGGGLVIFGIGGDAPGGLGDAVGIGNNASQSGNTDYDERIEQAETTLEAEPKNRQAMLTVARYQYLAAQQTLTDEGEVSDAAVDRFRSAVDAWERYLQTTPEGRRDDTVASLLLQAYPYSVSANDPPVAIERRYRRAAETAEVLAEARPSANAYLEVARYAYAAGETDLAEEAAEQAQRVVDDAQRQTLQRELKAAQRQGEAAQQEIRRLGRESSSSFEDPLGGLSGGAAGGGETPAP
jgi:tetratricopeptide (TPR) repeat protein